MSDGRNLNWRVNKNLDGSFPVEHVHLAVLMDIRDELRALTRIFRCPNFQDIPKKISSIDKKLARRRRKKP